MIEILTSFAALDTGLGESANKAIVNLIMLIILALPLGATPFIMKLMGGIGAQLGGIVNNKGKGIFDRTKNFGRNLSNKQTGAWKNMAKRKGTEWAANNYDPRNRYAPKNFAAMVAARKPALTRRQAIGMGSSVDQYEAQQIKEAEEYYSQIGIADDKEQLMQQVTKKGNSPYARLAAAKMAGSAGGGYLLQKEFETNSDGETRKIIAKAASTNGKVNEQATPFADGAKRYIEELNKKPGDYDNAAAGYAEEVPKKANQKFNAAYLMNQKVDEDKLIDLADLVGRDRFAKTLAKAKYDPATSSKFGDTHQELLTRLGSQYDVDPRTQPNPNANSGSGGTP